MFNKSVRNHIMCQTHHDHTYKNSKNGRRGIQWLTNESTRPYMISKVKMKKIYSEGITKKFPRHPKLIWSLR